MPRSTAVLIQDMAEAVAKIKNFTHGFQEERLDDPMTMDAVIRNLEVLGEAAKAVPDALREQHPSIDWRKLSGLRDILIHQYFGIDDSILRDIVSTKLPTLEEQIGTLA